MEIVEGMMRGIREGVEYIYLFIYCFFRILGFSVFNIVGNFCFV